MDPRPHHPHPGDRPQTASAQGAIGATEDAADARRGEGLRRVTEQVRLLAEPIVRASKCELVAMDFRREALGWGLRLMVEREGHDPRTPVGGVTLEQCARISRDVGTALDVAETIDHAYHLEVSSPGLERPLTKAEDYTRFVGLVARVQLHDPLPSLNRRSFKGELLPGSTATTIRLRDADVGEVLLPLSGVARAHLVYSPPEKPKPGKARKNVKPGRSAAAGPSGAAGDRVVNLDGALVAAREDDGPKGAR
jgi:ribosome maturation factor RimP